MATIVTIGAGLAGVIASRELVAAGHAVTVVDKGYTPGGRMATRRLDDATFDHGAQFFTARDPWFSELVDGWVRGGLATPWFASSPDVDADGDGHPRYRGSHGMRPLVEHLAAPLDVRTRFRVAALRLDARGWSVAADDGAELRADAVVCTAPVPQTLALLDDGGVTLPDDHREGLATIEYAPCVAVLARPSRPPTLPNGGALRLGAEPLEWVADNAAKGISAAPSVTIHAGPRTSAARWDEPDDELGRSLCEAAEPVVGAPLTPLRVHRWRFSRPTTPSRDEPFVLSEDPRLIAFAGDAFAGGRVEGAAVSGRTAAAALSSRLSAAG